MNEIYTIDLSEDKKIFGGKNYKCVPRIGEWINFGGEEKDGSPINDMYEVIMVIHSPEGRGTDIYVKYLQEGSKARLSLKG